MERQYFENILNDLKIKYKNDTEIWKSIPGFEKYEVSNLGNVKSLKRTINRLSPRLKTPTNYTYEDKIIKRLYCGINSTWPAIRLTYEQTKWKQLSLAKVIAAAFLNMKIEDLPRTIYFSDRNPKNLTLQNLTFFKLKKERKK